MELPDSNNSFGVTVRGTSFFIGNTPVKFDGRRIKINEIDLPLTLGLKELLFRSTPKKYNQVDLRNYKNIIFQTSAHKRDYDAFSSINANKTIKYNTIISKLFPPKRTPKNINSRRRNLIKNSKQLETSNTNNSKGENEESNDNCGESNNMLEKGDDYTSHEDKQNEESHYYDNPNMSVDKLRTYRGTWIKWAK